MIANTHPSTLDQLYQYHFKEEHLPWKTIIAMTQVGLWFFSAAGLLYAKPAMEMADTKTVSYLNAIGTCYSACVVLCAATIDFYQRHNAQQQVAEALKAILEPAMSEQEYHQTNKIIGAAAALCSIPFVTIAVAVEFLPPPYLYPGLFYIFIANALLHLLPIKLNLSHPFYGFLPRQKLF